MELLESDSARPRQARYQAALRPDIDFFIHSKALPTLLRIHTIVFGPDCARTVHERGYCTVTVHIGAAIRASAATDAISLARRLSFTSASRFICNFI
jgi:hypothetical protein